MTSNYATTTLRAMLLIFSFFSFILISFTHAEAQKGVLFVGKYEGRCFAGPQTVPSQVFISYDPNNPSELRMTYDSPLAGKGQERIGIVSRTVRDLASPDSDAYEAHEVSIKQEVRSGVIQTVLSQRTYSHRRFFHGKNGVYHTLTLTMSKAQQPGMPDQLVIEGSRSYGNCVLNRMK